MKTRRCGFCGKALHIVEDFVAMEGKTFHHQTTNGVDVHCARKERKFQELRDKPYFPILFFIPKKKKEES